MSRRWGGVTRRIGWALAALTACGDEPPEPLHAELVGCAEVFRSGDERLCVHQDGPPLHLVGRLTDPEAEGAELRRSGPERWSVGAPPDGVLVVRDGRRMGRWSLEALPANRALEQAFRLRREGESERAVGVLREALQRDPPPKPAARLRAALARAHLSAGHTDEALSALQESADAAASIGFVSQSLRDRLASADTLRRSGHPREAVERLAELTADPADPEGAVHLAYQRVLAARDSGDLRGALQRLDDAEASAERLAFEPTMRLVLLDLGMVRARLLQGLGRSGEATASLEAVASLAEAPCDRAAWHTNHGWVALLASEGASGGERLAALVRADSAFRIAAALHTEAGGCPDEARARNAAVNIALAALALGEPSRAESQLAKARAYDAPADARVDGWAALAEAKRLSSEHGSTRFQSVAQQATDRGLDGLAWAAWVALGRASRAQGSLADAIEAFEQAETILEARVDAVPFGEGRGPLAEHHGASARGLVDARLAAGDPAGALEALRRARSRPLRTLRSRARWLREAPAGLAVPWASYQQARAEEQAHRQSAWAVLESEREAFDARTRALASRSRRTLDALLASAPPLRAAQDPVRPGQLLLTWQEHEGGWRVFAATSESITVAPLARPPGPGAETSPMWAPVEGRLRASLARGDEVRLVLPAALASLPVETFLLSGEPLIARTPLRVSVDAGAAERAGSDADGDLLIVADPRGDLPAARAEGRSLSSGGGRLLVGDGATRSAVLGQLADASHFHYAGHASDAELLLASGETLRIDDVLTAPAPASAALLGCGTAAPPERDASLLSVGTLGLAQAFVLAGSRHVVATLRDVPDDVTADFARALGPEPLTAERFRRALLALRADHPTHWDAFRLLVP